MTNQDAGNPTAAAQDAVIEEEEVEELFSISERSRARVLNRDEIVMLLTTVTTALKISPQDRHNGRVCVGMVGYPNVGKSSVINTILGVSRASHGTSHRLPLYFLFLVAVYILTMVPYI